MTIKLKFSTDIYKGNEKDGIISVTVVANGVASFPYTIGVKPSVTSSGVLHPAQPDCDFVNETKFIKFEPKQGADLLQAQVNITVLPDKHGIGHNPEVFKVSHFLSSGIECSGIDIDTLSEAFIIVEMSSIQTLFYNNSHMHMIHT